MDLSRRVCSFLVSFFFLAKLGNFPGQPYSVASILRQKNECFVCKKNEEA